MLLFGSLSRKYKFVGTEGRQVCQSCGRKSQHYRVRLRKRFALYGVPVGEYGSTEYLICRKCQAVNPIGVLDELISLADNYKRLSPWDQVMARPLKGRKLRRAALRGRERGLQDFEQRYRCLNPYRQSLASQE